MTVSTTTERRPEPGTSPAHRPPPSHRSALAAIYIGLALTLLAVGAVAYDLIASHVLADHLHDTYSPHGVDPPGEGAVGAYLFTVGGLGVVGWMLSAWMVVRGNRSTRATVTTLLGISALVALAHLTVSEYGSTILAPAAGWVTLLLCLPGLVATVLLWRTAG